MKGSYQEKHTCGLLLFFKKFGKAEKHKQCWFNTQVEKWDTVLWEEHLTFLYTYGSSILWKTGSDDPCGSSRACSFGKPWKQSSEQTTRVLTSWPCLLKISSCLRPSCSQMAVKERYTSSLIYVQWQDSESLGILNKFFLYLISFD